MESKLFLFSYVYFYGCFTEILPVSSLSVMVLLSVKSALGLLPFDKAVHSVFYPSRLLMTQQFKIGHYTNSACI